MADEALFDDNISSEEILDTRRSLQEVIRYYQAQSMRKATEDEAAILVPVRAQVGLMKSTNTAFHAGLSQYKDFTLDNIETEQNVNGIKSFQDIRQSSGGLAVTPEIKNETKKTLDTYIKAIDNGSKTSDRQLETSSQIAQETELTTTENTVTSRATPTKPVPFTVDQSVGRPSEYKGKFANFTIKECLPCLERVFDLDFEPSADLLGQLQRSAYVGVELNGAIQDLLFNDDIYNDICRLLGFMQKQCVPDLANMIAILGILVAKFIDIGNVGGLSLSGLITPIFGPLLSTLVTLLDQYLKLIVAPVDCLIETLDDIIVFAKRLDVVSSGSFAANAISETGRRSKETGNKIIQLQKQRDALISESVDIRNEISALHERGETTFDQIRKGQTQLEALGMDVDGSIIRGGKIDVLNGKIDGARRELRSFVNNLSYDPKTFDKSEEKIQKVETQIASGVQSLQDLLFQGRTFIENKLNLTLEEMQKFVDIGAGNVLNQLETAQELQRLSRLISFLKVMISLTGLKDVDFCNPNNSASDFIGSFLKNVNPPDGTVTITDPDASPIPQIVTGTIGNEPQLIVFPPGTNLEITGKDQKPRDIEEVKKLNSSGVLPNVGDLADTTLAAIIPETGAALKPSVIPLDLCVKSGDPNAAGQIKDWISSLKS